MVIKVFVTCMVIVSGLLGAFCQRCTTQWFDRDDPSGNGDYELLSDLLSMYPGLICRNPTGIEVQTISGQPASQTGNTFQVNNAAQGFACVNAAQRRNQCVDYKVRFTCPETFCSPGCTTQWFDRDDPSGNGDYELLSDLLSMYPDSICRNPTGIEVQTTSGQPASQTGNIFSVNNAAQGFACVNAAQRRNQCVDYKVRFTCPETFCSSCRTAWVDRDDPSGRGDYETLEHIFTEYPQQVCSQPLAIEVTTISGTPALQTGNIFQVSDPLVGFVCVNDQQVGGYCQDYKVRFTCPYNFCRKP